MGAQVLLGSHELDAHKRALGYVGDSSKIWPLNEQEEALYERYDITYGIGALLRPGNVIG